MPYKFALVARCALMNDHRGGIVYAMENQAQLNLTPVVSSSAWDQNSSDMTDAFGLDVQLITMVSGYSTVLANRYYWLCDVCALDTTTIHRLPKVRPRITHCGAIKTPLETLPLACKHTWL